MATSRQQKWDWSMHLPKMMELYNLQMSIPDIHKALQCDGFEPCQRSVYLKFKSMGYPTDHVGRAKLLEAKLPSNAPTRNETGFNAWPNNLSLNFNANASLGSGLYSPPEDQILDDLNSWVSGHKVNSPGLEQTFEYPTIGHLTQVGNKQFGLGNQGLGQSGNCSVFAGASPTSAGSELPSSFQSPSETTDSQYAGTCTSAFEEDQFLDFDMELNGGAYFGIDTGSQDGQLAFQKGEQSTKDGGLSWESELNNLGWRPSPSNPSILEDFDASSLYGEAVEPFRRKSNSGSVKMPFQRLIGSSSTASTRNIFRSLFKPKPSGSSISSHSRKRYATSQFTHSTDDSGYATGHTSCLTLDQVRQMNAQSLKEFNGLYRVACHVLHEPQAKAQCKDIPTCSHCRYSSIHNLAWSSRYLKLEVFLSELKLEGVYDFGALDAAGNSALHYAAAGGAGFSHLKALIDIGVDPYVANTAGELFIYCLRPLQPFTLEPNSDCLKSDDLIRLLHLLDHQRISDWRDNDGQTIMHALALKITEPELKAKIFKMLHNVGYSSTVPDRFGRTAKDIAPLTYDCHGQVIDSAPFSSCHRINESDEETMSTNGLMEIQDPNVDEWRSRRVKQIKAQNILVEAWQKPSFIDPETGENAVHALSKLESSNDLLLRLEHFNLKDFNPNLHNREGNYILLNLEYFVARGIDLNLLNLEGSHPLRSFIRERPVKESETGATMSKYLDTILGKDLKERLSNKVKVNMKDREGATALHSAAILGRPDSVRSLIDAGANVNARSDNELSVLQATLHALDEAAKHNDTMLVYLIKEVISHLEHAGAVQDPTSLQERGMRAL